MKSRQGLTTVRVEDIASEMHFTMDDVFGSADPFLKELDLGGIWWMRGNPLPEELISFGRCQWDAALRMLKFPVELVRAC